MRAGALSVLFIAVSRSICGGLAHCRIWKIFIEWMSNHWWFIIVQITTELTSVSFSLLPLILGIPPEITQITRSTPSFSKSLHTLGCQSSLIEAYFAQFPHQLLLWHGFGVVIIQVIHHWEFLVLLLIPSTRHMTICGVWREIGKLFWLIWYWNALSLIKIIFCLRINDHGTIYVWCHYQNYSLTS